MNISLERAQKSRLFCVLCIISSCVMSTACTHDFVRPSIGGGLFGGGGEPRVYPINHAEMKRYCQIKVDNALWHGNIQSCISQETKLLRPRIASCREVRRPQNEQCVRNRQDFEMSMSALAAFVALNKTSSPGELNSLIQSNQGNPLAEGVVNEARSRLNQSCLSSFVSADNLPVQRDWLSQYSAVNTNECNAKKNTVLSNIQGIEFSSLETQQTIALKSPSSTAQSLRQWRNLEAYVRKYSGASDLNQSTPKAQGMLRELQTAEFARMKLTAIPELDGLLADQRRYAENDWTRDVHAYLLSRYVQENSLPSLLKAFQLTRDKQYLAQGLSRAKAGEDYDALVKRVAQQVGDARKQEPLRHGFLQYFRQRNTFETAFAAYEISDDINDEKLMRRLGRTDDDRLKVEALDDEKIDKLLLAHKNSNNREMIKRAYDLASSDQQRRKVEAVVIESLKDRQLIFNTRMEASGNVKSSGGSALAGTLGLGRRVSATITSLVKYEAMFDTSIYKPDFNYQVKAKVRIEVPGRVRGTKPCGFLLMSNCEFDDADVKYFDQPIEMTLNRGNGYKDRGETSIDWNSVSGGSGLASGMLFGGTIVFSATDEPRLKIVDIAVESMPRSTGSATESIPVKAQRGAAHPLDTAFLKAARSTKASKSTVGSGVSLDMSNAMGDAKRKIDVVDEKVQQSRSRNSGSPSSEASTSVKRPTTGVKSIKHLGTIDVALRKAFGYEVKCENGSSSTIFKTPWDDSRDWYRIYPVANDFVGKSSLSVEEAAAKFCK